MSWQLICELLEADLGSLSSADLIVLIALRVRAGKKGFCWPSAARIAKDANLSVRKVRGCIHKLERLGLIRSSEREGNRRSKVYWIVRPEGGYRVAERASCASCNRDANTGTSRANSGTTCRQTP